MSQSPVTATQWQVTYKADLVNTGVPLASVTAKVSSLNPFSFRTINGKDLLNFAPVPANSQVTSSNTFTILVDRSVNFSFNNLQWTYNTTAAAPVANAGPNQTVAVGSTAMLNGSASTNPSGNGTLSYAWAFVSRPSGSSTTLANRNSVMPTFVVDLAGQYVIQLTVSNGVDSNSATVTVSTTRTAPVANAGPDQTVPVGSTVILNGSGSTDADGNPITFKWTIKQRPANSIASLTNPTSVAPTFLADKTGLFVVELVVNDGVVDSVASAVKITSAVVAPVAKAGPNQVLPNIPAVVQLDGSGSTDANGLALTYLWALITVPQGSGATLDNPNIVNPKFTADVQGAYVAQLTVNNGTLSNNATVTITTNLPQAPVANAGIPQMVSDGSLVTLHGTASDPQGLPLTFQWSITTKPAGSTAALTNATSLSPTFIADLAGSYLIQLIANNGTLSSAPSTVTITTNLIKPVANPGSNQAVLPGATVTLDGSGSTDSNHNPLTYSWTFLSRPNGSGATLSGANTVSPTFVADVAGAYVAQLIVNDGFQSSLPATVMITASTVQTMTLAPNPLTVSNAGGATGTLTVTLSSQAGANGLIVHLLSSDPTIASVPASVVIGAGGSTAGIPVTPGSVGSATITASATGLASVTATVNVIKPAVSLALDSSTVGLNQTINGTFTLNAPAPPQGVNINLNSSPSGTVDVEPPSVKITSGNTTGSFTVTGLALGGATITAGAPGFSTASISIKVSDVTQIVLPSKATIGNGQSVGLPISLSAPAGAGGVTISLISGDTSKVTVSPSVFIPAGTTTPATLPQITGVSFGSAVITATASGLVSATETITVSSTLGFSPATLSNLAVGQTQNLNLTLSSPAPAGLVINLSSDNNGVATVPTSLPFPVNTTSLNVPVTGVGAGSATIHANGTGLADTTASVTVIATPPLGAIGLPSNVTVPAGQSVAFPVTLSVAAPASGVTVTLQTSDATVGTVSPASVFISAGQTTPSSQPQLTGVGFGSATITASAPQFTPGSQAVQVTGTLAFTPPTLTVTGTTGQNLTLTLSSPAPAAGLTVNLSSSNTNVASVPASIKVPASSNSVQIPVTGVANGTATIHASSLPNVPDTTAAVTVALARDIFLPANVTIAPGGQVAFPVTSTQPAPAGGIFVTITTGDASIATTNVTTVVIPQGATTSTTLLKLNGIAFGTTTITASSFGRIGDTETVVVSNTLSYFPSPIVVNGTNTVNVALTLASPAPAGGLTVNLKSDDPTVATVPATVQFAGNSSSATLAVTGVSGGTTTIHASSLPTIADSVATVNVLPPGALILPSNVSLAPGQSQTFAVMLGTPAPLGGVSVVLSSTDSTKVTISPGTVTVSGGQTQPSVQPQVTGVSLGTANINASAAGYVSASQPVKVTATINFNPASANIVGTATTNLTLNLSTPAPAGLVITLSSSPTGLVTIPPSISFATGATSVTVPVTGAGTGATTITASASGANIAPTTASITVAMATPSTITINGGGTQSQTVGLAFGTPFAVTVKDQSGNPVVANTSVTFTAVAGGNGQSGTFSNATGTITVNTNASGVATAGVFTANGKVGAYTVSVSASPATATFNLTNSAGPATHYAVSAPASVSNNVAFNITVFAQDSFNNTATGYTGTVHFSSSDGAAVLPGNSQLTNGGGTFSITLRTAPSQTVTATDTVTATINGSATITVAPPPPATHFSVSAPASAIVGTAFNFSVTALDVNNATVPSYSGTVHFTSTDGIAVLPGNATLTSGTGTFPATLKTVGAQTITATDTVTSSITGASGTINVSNPTATKFVVSAPANAGKGLAFNVTITAKDNNNATVTNYPGTVHLTSTDGSAALPANATLTNGVGVFSVTLNTAGSQTVTATDTVTSSITGASAAINVTLPATHFSVTAPGTAGAGAPINFTVTALDVNNQTATGYAGTVHFTSNDPRGAGLPANSTLTNGTGTFSATLNGAPSNTTITATDTVTASITGTSSVVAVSVGQPAIIVPTAGTPQSAQLNAVFGQNLVAMVTDAGGNPVNGTVTFAVVPGAGGQAGFFLTNSTSVGVNTSGGVATAPQFTANGFKGAYTVTATVFPAPNPAVFNLTNVSSVILGTTTVGQNLQANILVTLPHSFAGPTNVTLTSSDPSKLLLYNGSQTAPGASATITINGGDTAGILFVEGQGGGTGAVTVTGTLAGFDDGVTTVNVGNSGFVLSQQSGNGIGVSFTTPVGINQPLVVNSALLDASGNFVQIQAVRTNFSATISVALTSSTSAGSVASPVTFGSADDTHTTLFTSQAAGNTTVSITNPGNGFFATPTVGCPSSCLPANSVTITVTPPQLSMPNVSVGQNLQAANHILLNGIAPGNPNIATDGLHITVSTSDPNLRLSATSGGAPLTTIDVFAHAGQTQSQDFYVYALASTGSATFMAAAGQGFGSATATANFTPSAIVIAGPSTMPGDGIRTTQNAPASAVYVSSVQLNGSGGILAFQPVAQAQSITIVLNTSVGSPGVIASPVTIPAGTGGAQTTFTPQGNNGLGTLVVTEPTGFSVPGSSLNQISVTVNTPGISCNANATVTVGLNLQTQGSCSLGQLAPAAGVTITLTAQPGLLFSTSATTAGTSTLMVTVPSGGFNFGFFMQAVGAAVGDVPTFTAVASAGYNPGSGSMTVVASRPYVGGPNAFSNSAGAPTNVLHGTAQALTLYMALVDASGRATDHQALAGGTSVMLTITNSNANAGSIAPVNPVTIPGGTDGVALTFNAASGGTGQSTSISTPGGAIPPVALNVI